MTRTPIYNKAKADFRLDKGLPQEDKGPLPSRQQSKSICTTKHKTIMARQRSTYKKVEAYSDKSKACTKQGKCLATTRQWSIHIRTKAYL